MGAQEAGIIYSEMCGIIGFHSNFILDECILY